MIKLIFLDIDGVLNSHAFWDVATQAERHKEEGFPMCDIDRNAVEILNELIAETGAKIVISSSWRNLFSHFHLAHILGEMGLVGEIVGVTPRLHVKGDYGRSIPRGCEIDAWLHKNYTYRYDETVRYIILDDDSDMLLHQQENFFNVDHYVGLTRKTTYKAKRYLNRL